MRRLSVILSSLLLLGAAPVGVDADAAIDRADAMLARIGYRLATANAALCDRQAPVPGWLIHALDQYMPLPLAAGATVKGFEAPVAVALVVPGAPAAAADIRAGDALTQVAGQAMPGPRAGSVSSRTRDAATALVAAQPADRPLTVTVRRDGRERTVTIAASPGCRATFEVVPGRAMIADSDGTTVRIGVRFFERYAEGEVAAVVSHELAHLVLHHRERLEAAGVRWGLLSELGRNGRLFRRTEEEADLLGAALMRNAGWNPQIAVDFWRDHGGEVDGGLFRSRTHPSSSARAKAIAAAIERAPADRSALWRPPLLATRDQPLS